MSPLAYERRGTGVPIVFLHGLTFDRHSWRPIIDRLGDDVCSIAVDLPGHGGSPGSPRDLDDVAAQVYDLVEHLGVDRPMVVGHSAGGAVAMIYASRYPSRAAVNVDSPIDIRPFARLVQQLAPALRGPGFDDAFAPFQRSMRLDLLPEPVPQEIRQDIVLAYWDELMRSDPEAVQRRIEGAASAIDVPCLVVFGDGLSNEQRDCLHAYAPTAEIEEWPGRGHMLHLVEADRFTARLRSFLASLPSVTALERDALEHVGDGLARVDR
jgi:pimeloyl-ACP methyl ester carboxylesterase